MRMRKWCCLSRHCRAGGVLPAVKKGGNARRRKCARRCRAHQRRLAWVSMSWPGSRRPAFGDSLSAPASTIPVHAAEAQRQTDRQVLAVGPQLAHHAKAIVHVASSLDCARGRDPCRGQTRSRPVTTYQAMGTGARPAAQGDITARRGGWRQQRDRHL